MSDDRIIRHVADELSPDDDAALCAHIANCPACGDRVVAQRRLHAALGEWTVDPPLDHPREAFGRPDSIVASPRRRLRRAAILQIAAAVVSGIGIGHAAARLTVQRTVAPAVSDHDLEATLALNSIEDLSASGLPLVLRNLADSR